jgi:hypothetical protein
MKLNLYDAQQALGFLVSQTAHIEREVYEIKYPDIQYPNLIPVDTSANEWAKSITFYSMDKVGQAEWFSHLAKDVPLADVERSQHEHLIHMAAIGYRYTLEEIGQAQMVGQPLTSDRAAASYRAYEEFLDVRALTGDTQKSWTGLINDANVTAVDAAEGASNSTDWDDKTSDEIAKDINDALSGVYAESLTVEIADTVLLSVDRLNLIATKRVPDTNMTVLQYVMMHNVYTATTGRPLTIRAVRGLETAGDDDTSRMVVYRRDPQVLKMHLPMPHRFLPIWQTGPMIFDIPGIFRFGGVEVRRPKAMRYIDGIGNTAT